MTDPRPYTTDAYVLLAPGQPEELLSAPEMLDRLQTALARPGIALSPDVQRLPTTAAQAQYLLESDCELMLGPGDFLQWYAVRLEK